MTQSLRAIQAHTHSLSPTEAEVWVTAVGEETTQTTEIRGRVVGPHCLFASTVEIAYPLKPFARPPQGASPLTRRVLIPEPNLWDPQCPFLYRVLVELWQDGVCTSQAWFNYGLRSVLLTGQGLRWNGRPLVVRGTTRWPGSTEEAIELRKEGYNLLLAPVDNPLVLSIADQVGFLVLTQMPSPDPTTVSSPRSEPKESPSNGCPASVFGMLWGQHVLDGGAEMLDWLAGLKNRQYLVGIELNRAPQGPLPAATTFFVCREAVYHELAGIHLPRIVIRDGQSGDKGLPAWATAPGVLGWIDG